MSRRRRRERGFGERKKRGNGEREKRTAKGRRARVSEREQGQESVGIKKNKKKAAEGRRRGSDLLRAGPGKKRYGEYRSETEVDSSGYRWTRAGGVGCSGIAARHFWLGTVALPASRVTPAEAMVGKSKVGWICYSMNCK